MGDLDQFFFTKVFLPDQKLMIFRDNEGWYALCTRCTYDGCDLSYQGKSLFCTCCGSIYSTNGQVLKKPSKRSLPWYELTFEENQLYVNTEKVVSSSYRFTTPELEDILKRLQVEIREQRIGDVDVPKDIMGTESKPVRSMFTEGNQREIDERSMIK